MRDLNYYLFGRIPVSIAKAVVNQPIDTHLLKLLDETLHPLFDFGVNLLSCITGSTSPGKCESPQ